MTSGGGRHRGTIENRSMTGGGGTTRERIIIRATLVEKDFFFRGGEEGENRRFRFFDRLIGKSFVQIRVRIFRYELRESRICRD